MARVLKGDATRAAAASQSHGAARDAAGRIVKCETVSGERRVAALRHHLENIARF
jgi:hypothetical protein